MSSTLYYAQELHDDDEIHIPESPPLFLTFNNHKLEEEFKQYYYVHENGFCLKAMFYSMLIGFLFVINDFYKNSQGERLDFPATLIVVIIRQFITLTLVVVSYTLKQKNNWEPYMQLMLTFELLMFALPQGIFGYVEKDPLDPTYSIVVVLFSSMAVTVFRMRFYYCLVANIMMPITWVIAAISFYNDTSKQNFFISLVCIIVGLIVFTLFAYRREFGSRISFLSYKRLEQDEKESQKMLLRMLPISVISELRKGIEFIFREHDNVTVLFSHIAEFDKHTSSLEAYKIVKLLNVMFSVFDSLTDKYDVYKVETIGDVYMACAGCPESVIDGTDKIAKLAIDMREYVNDTFKNHNDDDDKDNDDNNNRIALIRLQMGINSGKVIAGVVGLKYPRYRLMGDTVNVASRMSTTCKSNEIQLTEYSASLLDVNVFNLKYKGIIRPKGKDPMKAYLLKGYNNMNNSSVEIHSEIDSDNDYDNKTEVLSSRVLLSHKRGVSMPTHVRTTSVSPRAVNQNILNFNDNNNRDDNNSSIQDDIVKKIDMFKIENQEASDAIILHDEQLNSPTKRTHTLSNFIDEKQSFVVSAKDVKMERLYSLPTYDVLRKNLKSYQLQFHHHPEIECAFREYYNEFYGSSYSRLYISKFILILLYATLVDVFIYYPDLNHHNVLICISLRTISILLLTLLYFISFIHLKLILSQYISAIILLYVSIELVYTHVVFDTVQETYGIFLIFLIVTLTSHYSGLRFPFIFIITTITFIFLFARTLFTALSAVMLLTANILNVIAAFQQEERSRNDFVCKRLAENEETRLRTFANEMLPPHVMDELKQLSSNNNDNQQKQNIHYHLGINNTQFGGKSFIVHEIHEASVMYSDIVQFTKLCSSVPAQDIVAILNVIFGVFDNCMILHHVYKVETIGDAYVACSGVVDRSEWHTQNLVRFAYDVQRRVRSFHSANKQPIRMRIGVHTGYVVAGVIGRKMPRYHLFGKTVSLAEEMEANGVPGGVMISGQTYKRLDKNFTCTKKPKLELKDITLQRFLIKNVEGLSEMVSSNDSGLKDVFSISPPKQSVQLADLLTVKAMPGTDSATVSLRRPNSMNNNNKEVSIPEKVFVNKWMDRVKEKRKEDTTSGPVSKRGSLIDFLERQESVPMEALKDNNEPVMEDSQDS